MGRLSLAYPKSSFARIFSALPGASLLDEGYRAPELELEDLGGGMPRFRHLRISGINIPRSIINEGTRNRSTPIVNAQAGKPIEF